MKVSKWFPFTLFGLLALPLIGAADYPISDRADSIHPLQESLVLTRLLRRVDRDKRLLRVEDAGRIDPRQWVLLISPDGSQQETHCIKSVSERDRDRRVVRLSDGLGRSFPGGSKLVQGSVDRTIGIVANLASAAEGGSSRVALDSTLEVDALRQVVLQSPDGRVREAHCVKAIVGTQVELVDELRNDYPKDSAVIQGRPAESPAERDENPCCCSGKRSGRG